MLRLGQLFCAKAHSPHKLSHSLTFDSPFLFPLSFQPHPLSGKVLLSSAHLVLVFCDSDLIRRCAQYNISYCSYFKRFNVQRLIRTITEDAQTTEDTIILPLFWFYYGLTIFSVTVKYPRVS